MIKKYLFIILLIFLTPAYLYAAGVNGVEHPAAVNGVATPDEVNGVSGLAAAGGCDTADQTQVDTGGSEESFVGVDAAHTYRASRIDIDGSGLECCAVDIYLKKVVGDSSPAWVVQVELWTESSSNPGSLLKTSQETLSAGDITTNYAAYKFTWAAAQTLAASTSYWVIVHATTLGDYGDYVDVGHHTSTTTDSARADGTPTWSDDGDWWIAHTLYK